MKIDRDTITDEEVVFRRWAREHYNLAEGSIRTDLGDMLDVGMLNPTIQDECQLMDEELHNMVWIRYVVRYSFEEELRPQTFTWKSIWDSDGSNTHDPGFAEICDHQLVAMEIGDVIYISYDESDDDCVYLVKRIE